MPDPARILLYAVVAAAFVSATFALGAGRDLRAIVLYAIGALALRATLRLLPNEDGA